MLQGPMLLGQMSPRHLLTNTGIPTSGVLTSNVRDLARYFYYTETGTNVAVTNVAWSYVPEIVAKE